MSKAFMKDDDGANTEDDELPDDVSLEEADEESETDGPNNGPSSGPAKLVKNYITPHGAQKLRDELEQLLGKERPKLVEVIAWAASNGDRSENADYIYGKRRLREIDKRVRFLHRRLDIAEVVDPEKQKADKVLFGATVEVSDENDEKKSYKIVGIDESDAKNFCVSWNSPIGKALLQSQAGDIVIVKTPKGDEELEVLKIEYKKIF